MKEKSQQKKFSKALIQRKAVRDKAKLEQAAVPHTPETPDFLAADTTRMGIKQLFKRSLKGMPNALPAKLSFFATYQGHFSVILRIKASMTTSS